MMVLFFFFPVDQHKTKITNTLQLLLNYGGRFIDKSIWQKNPLFFIIFCQQVELFTDFF